MTNPPFGLLNVNKPANVTSRRVVDHVVRLVKPAKVGHAGTLDPLATGVLVVCVGPATRLVAQIQQLDKVYRGQFELGCRSNTDDTTGEVIRDPNPPHITREDIERVLPRFVGRIQQTPPAFSAVHVDGMRAYKLARRGETVTIAAREVQIHSIEILRFDFPQLELEIGCGSGTYIRAIGRDLGEALGCGAVMSGLVRTRIGPFRLEEAVELDRLDRETLSAKLLPARMAVAHLGRYVCSDAELASIGCGRRIRFQRSAPNETLPSDGDLVALLAPNNELAALAQFNARDMGLVPIVSFIPKP